MVLTQPHCSTCLQVQDGQITHIQYEQGSQFLQEPQVRVQAWWLLQMGWRGRSGKEKVHVG